jgi:hypothetical protein
MGAIGYSRGARCSFVARVDVQRDMGAQTLNVAAAKNSAANLGGQEDVRVCMLDHAATCCTVLPYDLPTLLSGSILTANGSADMINRLHRERNSHASAWSVAHCTLHKTPQVSLCV